MKTYRPLVAALLLATVSATPFAAMAVPVVGDASFEAPAAPAIGYQYNPGGTSWTFVNSSGISADGGPFYSGSAQDGRQAAFIQSSSSSMGSITQTITGLTVGQAYNVVFYLAARNGYTINPVDVKLNGVDLGTFSTSTLSFVQETSATYIATATSALLAFTGTNIAPTDNNVALDAVSVNAVPEPASLALLGLSLAAVTVARRRNLI